MPFLEFLPREIMRRLMENKHGYYLFLLSRIPMNMGLIMLFFDKGKLTKKP